MSPGHVIDRFEALLTTVLRRRLAPVSTFTKPVDTLDHARGSSSACAPSLSSSSSTGNRGRDLRLCSVTALGISSSCEKPPDDVCFTTCVVGSAHLSVVNTLGG